MGPHAVRTVSPVQVPSELDPVLVLVLLDELEPDPEPADEPVPDAADDPVLDEVPELLEPLEPLEPEPEPDAAPVPEPAATGVVDATVEVASADSPACHPITRIPREASAPPSHPRTLMIAPVLP
ncbi:MAG: hypothetical protein J0G30_11275 [Actinomycetales bacterium]|nr:hypothetical protein [Actinomycetales bacterium]